MFTARSMGNIAIPVYTDKRFEKLKIVFVKGEAKILSPCERNFQDYH